MKLAIETLTTRLMGADEIPVLLQIQEEAFAAQAGDTDFLRRNTYETLAPCFSGGSRVLGVFSGEECIAFGILYDAEETKENLAYDVDCIDDILQSANVKLIIVRPAYRGNGLQRLLIDALQGYAKKNGKTWLCATVAPSNSYSMNNFIACGFTQHKVLQKYGGLQRALLIKAI